MISKRWPVGAEFGFPGDKEEVFSKGIYCREGVKKR
jgi:hypothetical protein